MKNMSKWVMVFVLALVGTAIWYEVQYRHAPKSEAGTPVRRASSSRKAAGPKPGQHATPTNESGQMIG